MAFFHPLSLSPCISDSGSFWWQWNMHVFWASPCKHSLLILALNVYYTSNQFTLLNLWIIYHSQNHFIPAFRKTPYCPDGIMKILLDRERFPVKRFFSFILVALISLPRSTNVLYECYFIRVFIWAFHRLSLAVWRCSGMTRPKRDDRIFSFPLRKGIKCVLFSTMSAIRMCFIAAGTQGAFPLANTFI